MGSTGNFKPHAVLVAYPATGHVNPMMKVGKLLHARGFHITFVNADYQHKRYFGSSGPKSVKALPDFRFESIADGMPPPGPDEAQDIYKLCDYTRKYCLGPFKELLDKLNSSPDNPPVTCVIADGIMSFSVKGAKEMGITEIQFYTTAACTFMVYLYFRELVKRGLVPFKAESFMTDGSLDTPIDWIPGMKNLRLRDCPSFVRTTDLDDLMFNFMGDEAVNCLEADALIFNTFDELEGQVIETMTSEFKCPKTYTIGPLCLLPKNIVPDDSPVNSITTSVWKPDSKCLEWLDQKEPGSVVYVNYGSITVMSEQHFREFAWGLANSKHPFLWIVRPNVMVGDSPMLSKEFLEETKDRGILASWCEQEKVLAHPSVGAFLTHCGWNSTTESMSAGVPLICWPFFGDQPMDCRFSCNEWEIGLEINHDVKRDEVAVVVKEMMEGEKGKKLREKAQELKKKAIKAADVGGSSFANFDRFIKEVLHYDG